jgi:hypothetical protein
MNRLLLLLLLLLLLRVVLMLGAPPAWAVTSQGASGEQVLVGPKSTPGPADRHGSWHEQPGRLSVDPHPSHDHYFVPKSPDFADGFVRLRVTTPREGAVAVGVRVAVTGDVRGLDGYALVVTRKDAHWARWDHGRLRAIDQPLAIDGLAKSAALDLELWAIGPHLGAQLRDGDSLAPLGALSVTDGKYTAGRTGLYVLARKSTPPVVTAWAVRPAKTVGQTAPSPQPPTWPGGPWRFVRTADCAGGRPAAAGLCRFTPDQLERRRRAGAELNVVPTEGPFRWLAQTTYLDGAMLGEELRRLVGPRCRLVELGQSAHGRPLWAIATTEAPDTAPALLIDGGHHGDELLSVDFALDAARGLCSEGDPDVVAWRRKVRAWVVPMVNPDGVQVQLDSSAARGRKNDADPAHEGVDLNRNYPFRWAALGDLGSSDWPGDDWFRGPRPASEPEVQAVMRLADGEHFVAGLSYHTLGTVILAPYTTDGMANPEPNEAWQLAQTLARALPVQPSGRRFQVKRQMYPVDGVSQDWLRAAHGTAALLLEGAVQNPTGDALRQRTVLATRPSWRALVAAVADGPRVSGRVLDVDGQPVTADVVVLEQAPKQGEHWQSRCRDGQFDRLLAKPGPGTLRVTVLGRAPVDVPFEAQPQAELEVRLPFVAHERHACVVPALCSRAALEADARRTCLAAL